MIGSRNIHSFVRLFLVSVVAFGLPVASAFAHSQLVKAEPPRRAALTKSPTQVRLWFNENIEGDYASLEVLDAKKRPISDKQPTLAPDDPKSIILSLPELAPGKYSVKFRVLSVDGHVVESSYDFSIKGGAQEK
ncbi:MAG: copper resistance protein CopC [Nitrospira sp.]|nr:copper resistance protein CopC [Nitrospira sp.]